MKVLYDVREMGAWLLLFSIVYSVILILLVLVWGLYRTLACAGPCMTFTALRMHHGLMQHPDFGQIERHSPPAEVRSILVGSDRAVPESRSQRAI